MRAMHLLLPLLSILAAASPSSAQRAPSWTGRDIAATAEPLTSTDLSGRTRSQASDVPVVVRGRGRDIGIRSPRSIYVDPYGNVTTFAGATPYWMRGQSYETRGSTPLEREFYGRPQTVPDQRSASPCVRGGGPATAASAIAQAASASGGGCG